MEKREILKRYFGYTSFRGGQEALIDSILYGHDALGIMPTGGGKSLCYQIPALMRSGVAVVISPLISLMKDQVMALRNASIPAAYINSSLSYDQMLRVYDNIRCGAYKIIYIAPERLNSYGFAELACEIDISLVAVDEAHCISEWGNDFRPSYLKIADFIDILPRRPVVAAFTATATELVRNDIESRLRLRSPLRIITGFDRPNLNFEVLRPQKKKDALLKLLRERSGKCGIIYCMTRKNVDKLYELLIKNGYPVTRYHAGLSDAERKRNQEDFVYDRREIMVATNAFGMGIDKSNVSYVIHYNMPMSLEAYYQEAGRAGRDGERADCILLYSTSDIRTAKLLIEYAEEAEEISEEQRQELVRRNYVRLYRMIDYCKTTSCLRKNILDYFGQEYDDRCDNCGNCRAVFKKREITLEAQKILSCVKRVYDKVGYSVGEALLARILRGSSDTRIISSGLNTITTYGIMSESSRGEISEMVAYLVDMEYMKKDSSYGALSLTDKAKRVLFCGERVFMTYREEPPKKKGKRGEVLSPVGTGLYERLRRLRAEIAAAERIPAYIVFSNATLVDMTVKRPINTLEFMDVSGVGTTKAAMYAERFTAEIRAYLEEMEKDI